MCIGGQLRTGGAKKYAAHSSTTPGADHHQISLPRRLDQSEWTCSTSCDDLDLNPIGCHTSSLDNMGGDSLSGAIHCLGVGTWADIPPSDNRGQEPTVRHRDSLDTGQTPCPLQRTNGFIRARNRSGITIGDHEIMIIGAHDDVPHSTGVVSSNNDNGNLHVMHNV